MEIGGKLKYVGLELMRKTAKSTDAPEVGLFRGLRSRTEGKTTLSLILIGDKDNHDSIRGVNADVFNVMTVLLKYGQTREMIVFKNTTEDQKEAKDLMDSILDKLKEDGLMLESDADIVDTEKYTEVDGEFFGAAKKSVGNTNTNTTAPLNTGPTEYQKKQAAEKKEKERQDKCRWTPFAMKRKSDKPIIKDLNIIKKKVQSIVAGDYVSPVAELVGDEEEEDKKTNTVAK